MFHIFPLGARTDNELGYLQTPCVYFSILFVKLEQSTAIAMHIPDYSCTVELK